ncbi:hypothetical protein HRG_012375 [Hirsutella rhossiliensis]
MKQKVLDNQRKLAESVPHVTEYRYFKKLHETIASYGINPADIWNMDETGFRIGIGRDRCRHEIKAIAILCNAKAGRNTRTATFKAVEY